MLTKMKVSFGKRNCSKCKMVVTCFTIIAMIFLWIEGTSGALQPNLTKVETWGETQIRATWQPFHQFHGKAHFYELYIDDYLEYFGNDLVYIARRLTPDTLYHFKLRSCLQESRICSPFSDLFPGLTAPSNKRRVTKSLMKWTIVCMMASCLAVTTALLGVKITRRLWRSFLYKYDYRAETNMCLPKCNASEIPFDEEPAKFPQKKEDTNLNTSNVSSNRMRNKSIRFLNNEATLYQRCNEFGSCAQSETCAKEESKVFVDEVEIFHEMKSLSKLNCEEDRRSVKTSISYRGHVKRRNNLSLTDKTNVQENSSQYNSVNFNLNRSYTSPKLRANKDIVLKEDNRCHKRTHSDDNRIFNLRRANAMTRAAVDPNNTCMTTVCGRMVPSSDVVIVVDNSNVFIGAQECATILNPYERKRNVRIKIQQLVKVFQKGRTVSRAFVQGSSPPKTDQVWEVYRRLGYSVDVEDRRGKDEQRVDEGLHLRIYKAIFELSPRTLVIASGDGNKGKSECATSFPECAKAAIDRGWAVEVHSWKHSTSLEWAKLEKLYPQHLSVHFLDRYLYNVTFVDGKYGRKCKQFTTNWYVKTRGINYEK